MCASKQSGDPALSALRSRVFNRHSWLTTKSAAAEEEEEARVSKPQAPHTLKMPSASVATAKKANAGPGYYDLIKEAVLTLKERNGSSRQAIDKYVAAKKGASYQKARLNIALKKGVEVGKLVAVKGSFKLAADEKKAPKVKKAAKPAADKKKKTVKKVSSVAKKSVKPASSKPKKSTTQAAKPKAASKTSKKATPATSKKVTKTSKKVSAKKPTTTKKKVVKKSAAKKVSGKKQA
ncbi:Histone h1, partial [Globisporangium splendens]